MDTYRARAQVPNPSLLDNIVKGFHDFLPRSLSIEPVDLQHVDVSAESFYACFNCVKDVLPR